MIVCFVDIGGIVDHHCLNFLFIITFVPFNTREILLLLEDGGSRGRNRMVVGFTTTCAISAYHHTSCSTNTAHGEVYSIQYYVIK